MKYLGSLFLIYLAYKISFSKPSKEKQNENTNLDILIDNYRPPIFWKDKPIIKKQLENWSMQRIKDLIININKTEEFLKKNSSISLMLVFNFIYETSEKS